MYEQELWEKFISTNNINSNEYDSWSFGGDADLLAKLVINGKKTATSSLYLLYELENEPLPKKDSYNIILNSKNEAVCIIQTKKVYVTPFNKITKEHAYKEGEGDKSLEYWQKIHEDFFSNCLKEINLKFSDDMEVVCEEFEMIFKP